MSGDNSAFLDASADGRDAFFATRQRLSRGDTDSFVDVYDARIGGGFPEPPLPLPCDGDSCQGSPPAAPNLPTPGSSAFNGAGDARQAKRKAAPEKCKKGFVRRQVKGKSRCVKQCKKGTVRRQVKGKSKCVAKRNGKGAKRAADRKKGKGVTRGTNR